MGQTGRRGRRDFLETKFVAVGADFAKSVRIFKIAAVAERTFVDEETALLGH